MLVPDKALSELAQTAGLELSTAALIGTLAEHGGTRLIFNYDGRDTLAGYHVTEVKAGQFASLDCGANPEAWTETFVQLWDVPEEEGRAPLSVPTFLAIIRKVAAAVPLIMDARLTFEVSDGVRPMELYRAEAVESEASAVRVFLAPRAASCKPRDRWLGNAAPPSRAACCAA